MTEQELAEKAILLGGQSTINALLAKIEILTITQNMTMLYLSENELVQEYTQWMQEKGGRMNVQTKP